MEQQNKTVTLDLWIELKKNTNARIALGRSGAALPTDKLLEFKLAHARARDSVHIPLNINVLKENLKFINLPILELETGATDRQLYLKRPDLGRELSENSREILAGEKKGFELCIVLGDGLSSTALQKNALPFLSEFFKLVHEWTVSPLCIVSQARVAVADEIGEILQSEISIILIGERPGLSSPDSMGLYLTYSPKKGKKDSERNCISNIRPDGLNVEIAAQKAFYLLSESRRKKLSGVGLKDEMGQKFLI